MLNKLLVLTSIIVLGMMIYDYLRCVYLCYSLSARLAVSIIISALVFVLPFSSQLYEVVELIGPTRHLIIFIGAVLAMAVDLVRCRACLKEKMGNEYNRNQNRLWRIVTGLFVLIYITALVFGK